MAFEPTYRRVGARLSEKVMLGTAGTRKPLTIHGSTIIAVVMHFIGPLPLVRDVSGLNFRKKDSEYRVMLTTSLRVRAFFSCKDAEV